MEQVVKIQVGVPIEAEEQVRTALGEAGAGHIGKYDCCSFTSYGTGRYRPLDGANPYKGETGALQEVKEAKIETICYAKDIKKIIAAIKASHPYEEVAYDIIPLLNHEAE